MARFMAALRGSRMHLPRDLPFQPSMSTPSQTLSESEIRPDHLLKGHAERYGADIARLLAHKDKFVPVACPACGADDARAAFDKLELTYVVCRDCETMYVNPRPTPELLGMYYAQSENYAYWNKHLFPASEHVRRERIFRPRAERVAEIFARYGVQSDTLLEIGAGFGTFCEEARRLGIFRRVIAVEPTPDLAETCRQRGLEVIEKPIEQISTEGLRVDAIACFEVLEHIFSPRHFLATCASVLNPGGLIVITCPSVKGFDIAVLGKASNSVDVEHLNYFHPVSLSRLAMENGFEVLEVSTPGKLDAELVRKKVLAGEFALTGQPFLQQVLIDEWDRVGASFQQFLADQGLSSHLWLIARKAA